MSQNEISRYPVPDVNSLPEDIRDRILAVQEKRVLSLTYF